MNKFAVVILLFAQCLLLACSPIKTPVSNQYKLNSFSNKKLTDKFTTQSIFINQPQAVAGYQTDQMLYVKRPFELSPFANSAWVDPPANMLFPLILQSVQRSGHFYAVASSPNPEQTDYRLDTQLIELEQNFLKNPSIVDLVVKIVLTHVKDGRVVASRLISQHVACPINTPYGGVIAANRATENFTAELTAFIVNQVKQDTHRR